MPNNIIVIALESPIKPSKKISDFRESPFEAQLEIIKQEIQKICKAFNNF